MEDQQNTPKGHEDEIGVSINDSNKKKEKTVDSFKTGNKKQDKYFDQPFDEQMHDPDPSENDERE